MRKYWPQLARCAAIVAATVVVSAVSAPSPVASAASPSHRSPVVSGSRSRAASVPLLLINGDRLDVSSEAGPEAVTLGATPDRDPLLTLHLAGTTYDLPVDAIPDLGRGLDPSLFNLSLLRHQERGGRLRVRLSYPGPAPSLPGVTITSAHGGRADGYLTPASAARFGHALARQFAAEHASGNYGNGSLLGGVTIALAGVAGPLAGPASRPRFPLHTLVVQATNEAGKPDTGGEIFVLNADNPFLFREVDEDVNFFYHGTTRFSLPAGHYWAAADFFTIRTSSGGRPHFVAQRLVVLPQFTVAGGITTVRMSAKAATSQVSFTTPRPTKPGLIDWLISRNSPHQHLTSLEATSQFGPMWISPLRAKRLVGTLTSATETTRSSPASASVPYYYLLDEVSPPDVIPSQHFVLNPARLATINQRYYSNTHRRVLWGVAGGDQAQLDDPFATVHIAGERTIPGTQTLYFTSNSDVIWRNRYTPPKSGIGTVSGWYSPRSGQNLTESFNEYPLHMQPDMQLLTDAAGPEFAQLPSAVRSGNEFSFFMNPFGDATSNFGHFNISPFTGHYTVQQNGTRIASGDSPGFEPIKLSSAPSLIKVSISADQNVPLALSPHTDTVWTFHSAPQPHALVSPAWYCYDSHLHRTQHCAVQPLLTLDYQVNGMGLNGVAPGGPQTVSVHVGHILLARQPAITSATAQVSFDGGKTWQPTTVTKVSAGNYQVAFNAAAKGDVTLKFTATDAAGGSISDTIANAYAVAAPTTGLRAACPAARPGYLRCFALYQPEVKTNRAIAAGIAGKPSRPIGWTAQQLEAAYKLPIKRGSHQTVAISIAFNTPHLASYLAAYRRQFKLPPCPVASGCFRVVNEFGRSDPKQLPPSGVNSGWDLEATLDVSMISAACPHCKIIVVEANSASAGDLARTDNTAAAMGAQVISNSYGGRETGGAVAFAKSYDHPGHTTVVASGDLGYSAANFPADLPTVTAVGGTILSRAAGRRGWRERTWRNVFGASASGCSAYEAKPSWQHDPHCPGRTVADVSAVAFNVPVYNPVYGGWVSVGGTSVAAPLVAGIYALAGNATKIPLGYAYSHRRFLFDITVGTNSFLLTPQDDCGSDYLCVAKKGYDAPTGLGTPDGIGAF